VIERNTDFDGLPEWYLSAVESAGNEDAKADRLRYFVRTAFPEIDVGSIGVRQQSLNS
jgi:hypothetical protein